MDFIRNYRDISHSNPNEYYILEREKRNTGPLTLPIDSYVTFSRYVIRCGYKIEPKSFTLQEWMDCGYKILARETKLSVEELHRIIDRMNLHSPFKGMRHKIYTELVLTTREAKIKEECEGATSEDRFKILDKYSNRHLWFVDLERPLVGHIVGKKQCQTGTYASGYECYDGEWQAPYLKNIRYHNLYKVSVPFKFDYLVYPEDLILKEIL